MNASNDLQPMIAIILRDSHLHARWLNTFSFLEYIGLRKIMKSQRAETMSAAVLGHAVEEGRHALGLKKLALKIGGAAFDTYAPESMLCAEEAEDYFQTLDHACETAFMDRPEDERSKLTYLYVTWLVEIRALEVYGLYKAALAQTEIAGKLDGLLACFLGQ
jgi:hypothetical protein